MQDWDKDAEGQYHDDDAQGGMVLVVWLYTFLVFMVGVFVGAWMW